MPKLIHSFQEPIAQGFNPSNSVTVTPTRTRKLVSASGTQTVKDANLSVSATYDDVTDALLTVPFSVTPPTVTSSDEGILTVDSTGRVTRVSDGTANVIVTTRGRKHVIATTVTRATGSGATALINLVSGSLGRAMVNAIAALLAGHTAPTFGDVPAKFGSVTASSTAADLFNADGSRNAEGWWGTIDVTCVPQTVGSNGVPVSPCDVVFTEHYGASNHLFRDNDGNTYPRSIIANRVIAGTDLRIARLNADLPSSIKFAKVLPSDWRSRLPQLQYGYPLVHTNQDRRLLIQDTYAMISQGGGPPEINITPSADAARGPWWYRVREGDSGSPAFFLIGGELVAIFTFHTGGGGPVFSDYITEINAAIAANGSPYSLTIKDLSAYTSY